MITMIISSCDKFSDLWYEHIRLLKEHWKGTLCRILLVTYKNTTQYFSDVEIIVAPSNFDFPKRIKYALDFVDTEYVLVTLDDYFLTNDVFYSNIYKLENIAKKKQIDYLLLYNRRKTNEKKYKPVGTLEKINLDKNYSVNLYPALWKKDFLIKTVKDNSTPWEYEFSLTKTAILENANCYFSPSGAFDILDVVRKGKILHKAKKYFVKNNIIIENRETISYLIEIKLWLMDRVSWYAPKKIQLLLKRILNKFGMKFFSDNQI